MTLIIIFLYQTESPRFAFLRVERDFVEAPSQMLENWVWEEEPLRKMSGHYKVTLITNQIIKELCHFHFLPLSTITIELSLILQDDSPIPKELLDKLIASRIANAGAFNLRQIILGTFDQRIHTTGNFIDVDNLVKGYYLLYLLVSKTY